LTLWKNKLTSLPKEMRNLVNLRELDCLYNTLELTQEDVQWLDALLSKDCSINI
jgi:Leucine-rich repeat (LRR) protein